MCAIQAAHRKSLLKRKLNPAIQANPNPLDSTQPRQMSFFDAVTDAPVTDASMPVPVPDAPALDAVMPVTDAPVIDELCKKRRVRATSEE